MKKFFKALALVLALALVIGVVPAQATSAKIKAKKTLYVDGAKGTSTDGKLTSGYKSRVAIYKLAGDKKSVAADHTYKAVIKSGESVTKTKKYVYAAELGKSVVEIFKDGESLGTSVITVKKNATDDTLTVTGFEDGQEVVCGVKTTVTLPRKGVDSDERRLYVDGELQTEVEGQPRVYEVTFKKDGDHKIKFEAFQGGKLDAATATKEITVKAVMPQPVSAKQVSASSFAVEFEANMEGLISKDDITNQMIYYKIADTPVVTGVIKSVEVKDKIVTVTMYSNFNNDTDYFFEYGSVDPIKFHTAKNDIKYATSLKLIEATAYYVGDEVTIGYAFYNADGVQLDVNDVPVFEVTSEAAYGIGSKIYFHTAGTATIKASITTGYDDETNKAITLSDTLTVNGVVKTASQTGKVYSFGAANEPTKEFHTIRIGSGLKVLSVKYTLSDNTTATINSTDAEYSIKSTDETVAMINGKSVYAVNTGSATIVLYKGDTVVDAFPITVLEAQKVSSATADLDKTTLNKAGNDEIVLKVVGKNLDGNNDSNYTVSVSQLENNQTVTGIAFDAAAANAAVTSSAVGVKTITIDKNMLNTIPDDDKTFNTIRLVVSVKVGSTEILNKVVSFAVSNQATANSYKVKATEASLNSSVKNWGDDNPADQVSTVYVASVFTSSYGDFYVADAPFDLIDSVAKIPATGPAAEKNYVIYSYPAKVAELTPNTVANSTGSNLYAVDISAFPTTPAADKRAVAGTYSFSGYHVSYATNGAKGVRTSLGNASVVVTKADVAASVEIVNGTAENFDTYKVSDLTKIFKVTWDGKNSKDDPTRVAIQPVTYSYDSVTKSYYVKEIQVALTLENTPVRTFYQKITVNKLFKDE